MTATETTVRIACPDCGVTPWHDGNICPACGRNNGPGPIDVLLDVCTAFRTLADFDRSVKLHGYTPSIYPDSRRKVLLTKALRALGYKVYDGSKVK